MVNINNKRVDEEVDDNNTSCWHNHQRTSFYKAIGPYGCQPDPSILDDSTGDTLIGFGKDSSGLWGKVTGYWNGSVVSDGSGYSGAIVNSLREGLGVYITRVGAIYRGEWKKGEPNGLGKWEYCDGSYYVGEFKAGRKDGRGYHYSPIGTGVTYFEVWSEGSLIEQSRVTQQQPYVSSWRARPSSAPTDSRVNGRSDGKQLEGPRISITDPLRTAELPPGPSESRRSSSRPRSRMDSGKPLSYGSHRSSVLMPPMDEGTALGSRGGPPSASSGLGPSPRSVVEWNTEDVVRWLSNTLHMPQYSDAFRRAHVSGPTLLLVNLQFLKSTLGIKSLGHRTKIIAAVDQLRHELSVAHEHGSSRGLYFSSASTSGSSARLHRPLLGSTQSMSSVTAIQPTLGEVPYDTWYIPFGDLQFGPRLDSRPESSPVGVYKGSWLGKDVAIRMYRAQLVNSNKWWSTVRHLDQIRHTNICLFMGVSISEPYYCIVWEFAEYGSLEDLLHFDRCPPGGKRHQVVKPPLPVSMALHIARGIAVACSYLQRIRGGLGDGPGGHLDLKPSNVLVDSSFNVKLTDFCLDEIESCFLLLPGETVRRTQRNHSIKRLDHADAAAAAAAAAADGCVIPVSVGGDKDLSKTATSATEQTATSSSNEEYCIADRRVLVRDASYMAPEVLRLPAWHSQLGIDYRCDIYSFGVILWELLTCRRAYVGLTNSQIRAYVGYGDGSLPKLCYSAPSDVRHLLKRCLDPNPANRPSFDSAIRRLARLQGRMNTVAEDALMSFMVGV